MIESILFFLRKKKTFFYTGLLAFTFSYAYILALYFFEWSDFQKDLFGSFLIFSVLWLLAFIISFRKNKDKFSDERQREKFDLLKQRIIHEFDLNSGSSIFEKIELISGFMKDNFSTKGLLSGKIMMLTNNSLTLYIENLQTQKQLQNAYSMVNENDIEKKSHYQQDILKNSEQNSDILNRLDSFIKELMDKKNNDKKMDTVLNEFQHSMEILNKITPK